nr:hypothetical protein Iba_scaffold14287CG0210 [Ipomoea batatas]
MKVKGNPLEVFQVTGDRLRGGDLIIHECTRLEYINVGPQICNDNSSLSSRLQFSVLKARTWDQSSSRCRFFRILDLRADSRFDTIRRCFLSSMIRWCCSSDSSEVELLLMLADREKSGGVIGRAFWGLLLMFKNLVK